MFGGSICIVFKVTMFNVFFFEKVLSGIYIGFLKITCSSCVYKGSIWKL